MLLERRTVSRKTPGDGRLEITKRAAGRLRDLGLAFDVDLGGERTAASLATMTCTCRGEEKPHEHYFLESTAFKRLTPGAEVELELEASTGVVRVRPAPAQ
ncbi:MAG: hypothetical protein ABR499_08945 [Gemmatimonadaceae bacterium]